MSINHYSSSFDTPPETTPWWPQQQMEEPIQNPSTNSEPPLIHPSWPRNFNLNNQNNDQGEEENDDDNNSSSKNNNDDDQSTTPTSRCENQGELDEKEHMFEKPLTPSDVGKLNRLVIPKQHAERYFPLGAAASGSGDSGGDSGKGLLLSFEDESGKCWRFRYSYWNSSQSYVLTKGWSRYVKDKRLDAGDVVLFERLRADSQRLFIGWRRRQQQHPSDSAPAHVSRVGHGRSSDGNGNRKNGVGVGLGWTSGFYPTQPYPTHHQHLPYQPEYCLHAERGSQGQNQTRRPMGNSSSSSSKVLRLFGVNMECQPEHDSGPSRPEYSNMSPTQGTATHHFYHQYHQHTSTTPHQYHMVRQQQPHYY